MPATSQAMFFVITTRGQLGPYTRAGLREALRAGDISVDDQVRTPFGSQLGSVGKQVQRESSRSSSASIPARPAAARSVSWNVLLLGGGAVLAVVVGIGWALSRATAPPVSTAHARIDAVPVVTALPPPAVGQSTITSIGGDRVTVQAPRPVPAPTATSASESPPATGLFVDLLEGNTNAWEYGGGATVSRQGDRGWHARFPASGSWIGIAIPPSARDWTGSGALTVSAEVASGTGPLTVEVVKKGGERHVASLDPPPGGSGEMRYSWSQFTRRSWQDRSAPDDGLQVNHIRYIRYLAFWPTNGGLDVVMRGIRLAP